MPSLWRALAYVACAIPAAIGVAFVARYGYATSDTPDAGYATAALYGVVAAFAFGGPAYAIATGNGGRKGAAWVIWGLAGLAIITNGTHTLGAIAQRSAGTEAKAVSAKSSAANDRKELERLEKAIAALPQFAPADADAVAAARTAAKTAERARVAECGDGDPKQRGKNCRKYEEDEKAAADKLTAASTNKALTDRAAALEGDAKAIRAKLGNSTPTPSVNALGEALGRIFDMPAATAATLQQMLVAVLVELIIAAILAMPELLRPRELAAVSAAKQDEPRAAGVMSEPATPAAPDVPAGSVRRFMLACIKRAAGERVTRGAVYKRYMRWCDEQQPRAEPLPIPAFWNEFEPLCTRVDIKLRERAGKVWCVDIQLAA